MNESGNYDGEEEEENEYSLVMSFWIDTDGYTDRDREMFVAGVEFQMLYAAVRDGEGWNQCIHSENSARARMMLANMGASYTMGLSKGGWVDLKVASKAS